MLSLNHCAIMGRAGPQPMILTLLMLPCVTIALYLASVVLLKQTIGE